MPFTSEGLRDEYRGHVIETHTTGFMNGLRRGSYIVMRIEGNNTFRLVIQGQLEQLLMDDAEAIAAARAEAVRKLDAILGA